jgi:hypothetical protein
MGTRREPRSEPRDGRPAHPGRRAQERHAVPARLGRALARKDYVVAIRAHAATEPGSQNLAAADLDLTAEDLDAIPPQSGIGGRGFDYSGGAARSFTPRSASTAEA